MKTELTEKERQGWSNNKKRNYIEKQAKTVQKRKDKAKKTEEEGQGQDYK